MMGKSRQLHKEEAKRGKGANKRCVCYVADTEYLFPTVLSAIQARQHLAKQCGDVLVFADGVDPHILNAFSRVCNEKDVRLIDVPSQVAQIFKQLQRKDPEFHRRISASAMGRLALAEILPAQYTEFLYLDGDTQVVSNLSPLLSFPVPAGKFMAARDYATIMRPFNKPWAASIQEHHDHLGLSAEQSANYFNSGVIRASRKSWAEIGRNALRFYLDHPEKCAPFHDMGALNGSAIDDLIVMSNRWNFPRHFMRMNLGNHPKPAIYHYMANPKPWHGVFLPWGRQEFMVYAELRTAYAELADYMPRLTAARWAGYKLKTTKSYILDRLSKPTSADIVASLHDRCFPI